MLRKLSGVVAITYTTQRLVKVACFQGDLACLFSRVAYNAIWKFFQVFE